MLLCGKIYRFFINFVNACRCQLGLLADATSTQYGRYCPTRGPFGLSYMSEIFSKKLDQKIEGLVGVAKSRNGFLIYGKNTDGHDKRMDEFLIKMSEEGGHKISASGIQPLEIKTDAITKLSAPQNITELRRFIGMAQQLSKFSVQLADASQPLRDLLSTKNVWIWTPKHTKSFEKVKQVLCSPPILAHYGVHKPTKIRPDGSKLNGITVISSQNTMQDGDLLHMHHGIFQQPRRTIITLKQSY